jgi:ketosteroid isomerase-like protein
MPEENAEEILRNAHAAFNRRDLEAFVSIWSTDCEYHPGLERDLDGATRSYHRHDGIRRWWREMTESWEDASTEIHEIRPAGDELFATITLHARGKGSGAVVEAPFFQVVSTRDGKIVRSLDFANRAQALEAAGLSE